jgi:hypothetical protein
MIGRIGVIGCAVALLSATSVFAEPSATGTVLRIDQPSTLILNDGRTFPLKGETVVMVNGVPVRELFPGDQVVIHPDGDPAEYPAAAVSR